jgi:hypothetical protein
VAFGSMVLFNGLTSTCSLSILLENELNWIESPLTFIKSSTTTPSKIDLS